MFVNGNELMLHLSICAFVPKGYAPWNSMERIRWQRIFNQELNTL